MQAGKDGGEHGRLWRKLSGHGQSQGGRACGEAFVWPGAWRLWPGLRHAKPGLRHAKPGLRHAKPGLRHAKPGSCHAWPGVWRGRFGQGISHA
eukprot:365993-Chlamydomonas_euryale.AAC.11